MSTTTEEPRRFEDGLQTLWIFHGQIRRSLELLDQLASWFPDEIQPFRARALYRFFTGPLLEHEADEDEVLAPALRAARHPRHLEADLERSRRQHGEMRALIEAILPHLRAVGDEEDAPNPAVLTSAAVDLRALLEPHLALEERVVFPLARGLLTPEQLELFDEQISLRVARRSSGADEHASW